MGHDVTTNLATPLNMGDILDFAENSDTCTFIYTKGEGDQKKYYTLCSLSVFSLAKSLQLILEISATQATDLLVICG